MPVNLNRTPEEDPLLSRLCTITSAKGVTHRRWWEGHGCAAPAAGPGRGCSRGTPGSGASQCIVSSGFPLRTAELRKCKLSFRKMYRTRVFSWENCQVFARERVIQGFVSCELPASSLSGQGVNNTREKCSLAAFTEQSLVLQQQDKSKISKLSRIAVISQGCCC